MYVAQGTRTVLAIHLGAPAPPRRDHEQWMLCRTRRRAAVPIAHGRVPDPNALSSRGRALRRAAARALVPAAAADAQGRDLDLAGAAAAFAGSEGAEAALGVCRQWERGRAAEERERGREAVRVVPDEFVAGAAGARDGREARGVRGAAVGRAAGGGGGKGKGVWGREEDAEGGGEGEENGTMGKIWCIVLMDGEVVGFEEEVRGKWGESEESL
jgi:hypothetical protein